jgi:hypothetical protein
MKKLIGVAAFAFILSLAASFGMGRIEISSRPNYDQQRDQQWRQSQLNQQRAEQYRAQQQRDRWQRDQWQREQVRHNQRHERSWTYELWLPRHQHDYDNRR